MWLRLCSLLKRSTFEREMSEELQTHRDMYADELVTRGVPAEEAKRRARLEFGTLDAIKEDCRDARGLRWFDEITRDLRFAVRVLLRTPGFTVSALVILAAVIGVNAAIFGVVDAVILRGLPYPDSDRLARIVTVLEKSGVRRRQESHTGSTWEVVRKGASELDVAAYSESSAGVNFVPKERPRFVRQQRVSSGFFRVLGVEPWLGREFTPDEDRPGGAAVTILSHALFQSGLRGDASALGERVLLRGEPHTVVGVMPEDFATHLPADLWTPLRPSTEGEGRGRNYSLITRLREDVSWPQARSQIAAAGRDAMARLRIPPETTARLELAPLEQTLAAPFRGSLTLSLLAVLAVLVIGCINVAGLMLARAATRTREIATRIVLGGGRRRISRQLLTESTVLAAMGGILGLALGYALIETVEPLVRESLGLWQTIELEPRVLAVTMTTALATSIAFGLVPALSASRLDVRRALGGGGQRGIAGGRSHWPRRLLLLAQVAMGVVLLTGAGLLLRSLSYLNHLEPGFVPNNLITATLSLHDARYTTSASVEGLVDESLRRIAGLAGVEAAAVSLSLPYETWLNMPVRFRGSTGTTDEGVTTLNYVTPGYLETLRVPLLEGRPLEERDVRDARKVVVVSRAFAERYFPEADPVGESVALAFSNGELREIVGVVADVQQRPNLGGYGPLGAPPALYLPISQTPDALVQVAHTWFSPSWIVRTVRSDGSLLTEMSEAVASVDPLLPFSTFRSFAELRRAALLRQRFHALLLAAMAGLAVLLVAAGIAGLIAHSVAERRRELGIRVAVGATSLQAVGTAALPGLALALGGIIVGSALASVLVQLLEAFIWGVRPLDPVTFIGVALGLLAVAAVASIAPALRILRLDPAETLRAD